jgi:hypothetical protein
MLSTLTSFPEFLHSPLSRTGLTSSLGMKAECCLVGESLETGVEESGAGVWSSRGVWRTEFGD